MLTRRAVTVAAPAAGALLAAVAVRATGGDWGRSLAVAAAVTLLGLLGDLLLTRPPFAAGRVTTRPRRPRAAGPSGWRRRRPGDAR